MSIESPAISYYAEYSTLGEKTTFNFSKLPDVLGTGVVYMVRVEYIVKPISSEKEVYSEALLGSFTTKPLAPKNLKVMPENQEVCWTCSPTVSVSTYKVRWKSTEEGSKVEEAIVFAQQDDTNSCSFKVKVLLLVQVIFNIRNTAGSHPKHSIQSEHFCNR